MNNLKLNAAVISTLGQFIVSGGIGLTATHANADWVNLPTAGFTINTPSTNQPTGTSTYTRCNMTGNYGMDETTRASSNSDACYLTGTPDSSITTLLLSTIRPIVLNNSYTNNLNVTIGEIEDVVWGNGTSLNNSDDCVYSLHLYLYEVDYDLNTSGVQTIEINGISRGGFGTKSISAAYQQTLSEGAVYRLGRAFTSVQTRADETDNTILASGYVHRPLISTAPPSGTAINGISTWSSPLPIPSASQQTAAIRSNWVEFTVDINAEDQDGYTNSESSKLLVRANGSGGGNTSASGCPAKNAAGTSATLVANAYRFRQTGQQEAPLFEFTMPGYIPHSGNTNF